MSSQTENSSKKTLETVSEQNRVSLYSVNFTEIVNQPEAKNVVAQVKKIEDFEKQNSQGAFSEILFRWRGVIALTSILVIGVLHFAFQISFQNEVSENLPAAKVPVVNMPPKEFPKIEPADEIKPNEPRTKKTERVQTRKFEPPVKTRPIENTPSKPQIRRKAPVETTAERLRRAEKILTGV